ncbi:cache domain-containing protein [Polaromonas jejuensis]|uniref:HAMP domain-containing protein n=1 Tax=Polaromonas jejuensis TaxID=457502 RepID=A0ABW0Q8M3_9BURK|nr:cache domain-containing protein [Polaromonas jejuensis]
MSLAELAASRIVFDGAQRELEQLGRRTQEQLLRFQEPARAWLEATTSDPRAGLEGENDISLLRMQMSMQNRYPQIGSLVFGYPDGSYQQSMVLRTERDRAWAGSLPEARFAQQIIRVDEREKRVEEWVFYDQQMTAIASEQRPWASRYDPRASPWYQGASELNLGTFQATDPFVLQLPAEFGMALSRPLIGPKGGVAAAMFTVAGLSDFLRARGEESHAELILFDEQGRVWGWSRADRLRRLLASGTPASLTALGDPLYAALQPLVAEVSPKDTSIHSVEGAAGQRFAAVVMPMEGVFSRRAYVALVSDQNLLLAQVRRMRWMLLGVGLAGLLLLMPMLFWMANRLATPLKNLVRAAKHIRQFEFDSDIPQDSGIAEVRRLQESLALARVALQGFARYVPQPLVQHFIANRLTPQAGVEQRELAVLCAALDERKAATWSPHADHYLQILAVEVAQGKGMMDRYESCTAVALWNTPLNLSNPARYACEVALRALHSMQALAQGRDAPVAPPCFGLDIGNATVGNFGTWDHLTFTAVGAPLDRARALAQQARALGVNIAASRAVATAAAKYFRFRLAATVPLGSNGEPHEVYELVERLVREHDAKPDKVSVAAL